MNDIDIEEGRRLVAKLRVIAVSAKEPITSTVLDAADAIETGRQWETIARLADQVGGHQDETCNAPFGGKCLCGWGEFEAAFRAIADRTPSSRKGA